MAWLRDGEKISKISLFVLTQLTNVTDTHHTHRMTVYRPRLCIASRGKKCVANLMVSADFVILDLKRCLRYRRRQLEKILDPNWGRSPARPLESTAPATDE